MHAHDLAKNRFAEDGDWMARQFFSTEDLRLCPEEYAARHAHEWECFSLHLHPFLDAPLGDWVRRFGEIFSDAEELDRCRRRFLTADELAQVQREEAEGI